MSLALVTAPSIEPVSLGEAKEHLRVDSDAEDALISAQIQGARMRAEVMTRRSFITTRWRQNFESWPGNGRAFELERPPLIALVSLQYVDINEVLQTVAGADLEVDSDSEPGRIGKRNGVWPASLSPYALRRIRITYDAGYGPAASNVPQSIKDLILLLAAHAFEHREPVQEIPYQELPLTVRNLVYINRWGSYP